MIGAISLFAFLLMKSLILLCGILNLNEQYLRIYLLLNGIGLLLQFVICFFLPLNYFSGVIFSMLNDINGIIVIYLFKIEISHRLIT